MIWAILAMLGVPLWLCAIAILTVLMRNRALRKRPGNVPVRVRRKGKRRWMPGHGVWVSDVFAYRGLPAAWSEGLLRVTAASVRPADTEERKHLRWTGDEPVIATLTVEEAGETSRIEVAARASDAQTLLGPFDTREGDALGGGHSLRGLTAPGRPPIAVKRISARDSQGAATGADAPTRQCSGRHHPDRMMLGVPLAREHAGGRSAARTPATEDRMATGPVQLSHVACATRPPRRERRGGRGGAPLPTEQGDR